MRTMILQYSISKTTIEKHCSVITFKEIIFKHTFLLTKDDGRFQQTQGFKHKKVFHQYLY